MDFRHPRKVSKWQRIKKWISGHRLFVIITVSVLLIGGASAAAFAVLYPEKTPHISVFSTTKPKPAPKYYSPLTGVQVADEATTKQAVTAIMIENSPDARPQSGIKDAGVIYEAIAEGGITRFLTLHQENKPQMIGPVRSLRMYYVDWLAPYNASVAHVGGSKYALDEVRNGSYRDIDQFFNSPYYWRATDRYAPHNVYTSFAKLDALNSAKGYTTSTFTGFKRTDGKPSEKPDATQLNIKISGPLYNTTYTYDPGTNTYARSLAGVPHKDREKGQLTPSVVIAMYVDMKKVMEDGWREDITTTGSGRAVVFQNGTANEVTWKKTSRSAQLQFVNADGSELALVRGQTWISAVPNSGGSATWQ